MSGDNQYGTDSLCSKNNTIHSGQVRVGATIHGCDEHRSAISSEEVGYWKNVDLYMGGVEHAVLHRLHSVLQKFC